MPKKKSKQEEDNYPAFEQGLYRKILPKEKYEPGIPRCFVLDGMNIAYQSYYAYKKLSYKGKSVAILHGMPQIIRRLIKEHKPGKIIVVWDGLRSKKRLKWLPGYKSHRASNMSEKERAAMLKQVATLRLLLYRLGIPQVHDERIEGDDAIYIVAQQQLKLMPVTVVSGDKDMAQMVNHDLNILNPRQNHPKYPPTSMGPWAFSVHFGVRIDQIVDYHVLVGDSSDDIPGVKGIGPVRACNFLRMFSSIKDYLKDDKAEFSGMNDKDKLRKIWKRNRRLMDLKWFCEKYHSKKQIRYFKDKKYPNYNEEKYMALCMKYNLKEMRLPGFIKSFTDGQRD